jgi:hypothetical protein
LHKVVQWATSHRKPGDHRPDHGERAERYHAGNQQFDRWRNRCMLGPIGMSDGLRPDDFRAKLLGDREHTADWRVEKLQGDGEVDVAVFSGGDARQRAMRYAEREKEPTTKSS